MIKEHPLQITLLVNNIIKEFKIPSRIISADSEDIDDLKIN